MLAVMFALIDNAFASLIASAIPASTVVVLAATGCLLGERVGVLNLGRRDSSGLALSTRSSRSRRGAPPARGSRC
jgi:hypothetical protein